MIGGTLCGILLRVVEIFRDQKQHHEVLLCRSGEHFHWPNIYLSIYLFIYLNRVRYVRPKVTHWHNRVGILTWDISLWLVQRYDHKPYATPNHLSPHALSILSRVHTWRGLEWHFPASAYLMPMYWKHLWCEGPTHTDHYLLAQLHLYYLYFPNFDNT